MRGRRRDIPRRKERSDENSKLDDEAVVFFSQPNETGRSVRVRERVAKGTRRVRIVAATESDMR
jgi:hypothetical protein